MGLLSLLLVLSIGGGARAPAQLELYSALEQLRPDRPLPSKTQGGVLELLRGECELRQLALRSEATIGSVSVEVHEAPAHVELRLFRAAIVELTRPSGPDGARGRYFDPLVPVRDAYAGEPRRAFPFRLPARETRVVLIELCAPRAASSGRDEVALSVSLDAVRRTITLPVRIHEVAIPATASLATSFGFSSRRAALGHYGRQPSDAELFALDGRYRTALLAHRLSAHGGTMDPPPFRRTPQGLQLDFHRYDAELRPFLEGTALASGARATTTELRTHPALRSDDGRIAYWRALAAHHRERGWKALLFDYAKDEPTRADLPAIAARARSVKAAAPEIQVLVTASFDESLASLVDLWTPNLNCLFVRVRPDEFCRWRAPRASYPRTTWWYQSCSSHGCDDGPASAYFRGWPSYMIDAAPARARAMGWLAFLEGIEGELYFDTVFAYAPEGRPADPWARGALFAFGGNGDGTLFYPGTPARIGGSSHVPVESLRLKQIRDGLEDYELLRLVAARPGGRAFARRAAREVAPRIYDIASDPAVLEGARARLLSFLRQAPTRE